MHISSIKELVSFLSVLQEEKHVDLKAEKYMSQLEADKKSYNIQDVKMNKENTDEAEEFKEDEVEEEEVEVEEEPKPSKITPTLDSLIRNINDLRSGESLKRAEIRDEVGDYFDSLSQEEQEVLVLFLRELAAVVTKAKPGSEAQDPSEEPAKIVIKKTKKELSKEVQPTKKTPSTGDSIEDDSAPIKVNESQDMSDLRKRFKILQD